jgi:mannose-6-phosphate isomerase-like protein (cupin superfamily)
MKLTKATEKVTITPTETTTIFEYAASDTAISGAVATINGRYPEYGFAVNKISKELVYVVSGSGKIITSSQEKDITEGDVIFLDAQEKFAWSGNMVLFMATAPKFDPNQHTITSIDIKKTI